MKKIDDEIMLKMIEEGKNQKEVATHFRVSPAAVCKRLKKYPPLPESVKKLTDKQQKFAIEVASGKTKTQAALSSYECGSMESAKDIGKQLIRRSDIQTAVAEIMQNVGLTRTYRVQKLKQHVDNRDANVSLKALDQSWKLDGAYTQKVDITVGPSPVELYHKLTERITKLKKMLNEDTMDADYEEETEDQD